MTNDTEDLLIDEISVNVSKEIPPYIGITGDALTSHIKKGILKYKEMASSGLNKKITDTLNDAYKLLEEFECTKDEDSLSSSFFKAHINEDWFYHVLFEIEKLKGKTCLCGNEATINGAWCETCFPYTH